MSCDETPTCDCFHCEAIREPLRKEIEHHKYFHEHYVKKYEHIKNIAPFARGLIDELAKLKGYKKVKHLYKKLNSYALPDYAGFRFDIEIVDKENPQNNIEMTVDDLEYAIMRMKAINKQNPYKHLKKDTQ